MSSPSDHSRCHQCAANHNWTRRIPILDIESGLNVHSRGYREYNRVSTSYAVLRAILRHAETSRVPSQSRETGIPLCGLSPRSVTRGTKALPYYCNRLIVFEKVSLLLPYQAPASSSHSCKRTMHLDNESSASVSIGQPVILAAIGHPALS